MSDLIKQRTRDEIPNQDKWDVERIYQSTQEWEADFAKLKELAVKIPEFYTKLNEAPMLYGYFQLNEEVSRLADKLFNYASLRSDEDTANNEFLAIKSKLFAYLAEVEAMGSYFVPELLSYPEGTIEDEIKALPQLELYRFALEQILKAKPHTLDENSEKLLASVSDCLSASSNVFGLFTNADMTFPEIKNEDGQLVELTESEYHQYIISKNRDVRRGAFETLFNTYGNYKNTFAALLTSSVKNFVFESRIRNYQSALECSLKPNDIPVEVYHNSVETINKSMASLHRYVTLKKKLLNLEEIHMYDLYAPVIDVPEWRIDYDEAVELIKEGLEPLGKEYLAIFSKGIGSRWVDKYPNKGKCSGAYSAGCYDTQPYILLNYNYTLEDVSTLAHEMGHSVHSYYSRHAQPFIYADYCLFCAEVASTTNEALLMHYMIAREEDKNKKLYLVNLLLEQIRLTVYRQLMFAEFELFTHEQLEMGNPLTSEDLCGFWHELNVKYYGPDIVVDSEIDMEWARIPHFYEDFYVYQYATGYAAANSFARMILDKEEDAVDKYIGFLKSGASDYPINILKKAGVDMTTSKPLEDTIQVFNNLMDMIENR